MKKLIVTFIGSVLFLSLLSSSNLYAKESQMPKSMSQGTPITSENIVDVLEIQRIIDAQVNAYDTQQWELAQSLLTDIFETNLGLKEIVKMESKAFIDNARGYHANSEEFITHHSNSGYRIYFHDKNTATAFARGVIIVKSTPGGEYAKEGGGVKNGEVEQLRIWDGEIRQWLANKQNFN